jgi:uncharacterized membrane protein
MQSILKGVVVAIVATVFLASCAVMPVGPTWPAYPGSRSTAQQFQIDDDACRARANAYFGPAPAQSANNAAAAHVTGATLFGAALGALLGAAVGDPGTGAAIGAGTGLLGGSIAASDMNGYSTAQLQVTYDRVYSQCMYALGHLVPARTLAHRSTRGYRVPSDAVPSAGYPPAGTPPPSGTYAPPTTVAPPAGYPPPGTPPPGAAPRG